MPWLDFSLASLARIVALIGLVWGAGLYFYQDRLLHYPEPITPEQAQAEAARLHLSPWPDGREPRAWLRSTPAPRGTVVLFHGNGGHALHRAWFADEMEKLGMRTLLAEYPGYGHRVGGRTERKLVGDARATIALARRSFPGLLLIAGESLGAAIAAGTQADPAAGGDGILLITPWRTLREVAAFHYPWLPVGLMLRDRYDSAAALSAFSGKQVVVLAGRDALIPPDQGRRFFEGLQGRKRLVEVAGAGHNDWPDHITSSQWQEIVDFLAGVPRPDEAPAVAQKRK